MRRRRPCVHLAFAAVAAAACADAAPPTSPAAGGAPVLSPLLGGVEGAADTKAPGSWKVGMRFVWLSTNGVTQSHPGQMGMRRDPNGKLRDEKGNTWTESSPLGGTSGGVGYTVIDVVGADGDSFVLDLQQHLLPNGPDGPTQHTGSEGLRVHRTGGEFFLHPALLAKVPAVESGSVIVFRGPYETASGVRPSLRSTSVVNGYASSVYDLESGVLLAASYGFVQHRGDVHDPEGWMSKATTLTTGTHRWRGTRTPGRPWASGAMPSWVATARRLTYRGAATAGSPGLPSNSVGLTISFTRKAVGAGWALHERASAYDQSPGIPVIPSVSTFASGTASALGLFVDPAALARLNQGQRLDDDPFLGTTTVDFVGGDPDGRPVVAIGLAGRIQRVQAIYDARDGRLVRHVTTETTPGTNLTNVRDIRLVATD